MARLYSCGFELNSVTTGVEFSQLNGGTIGTVNVRSGTYSFKVNTGTDSFRQRLSASNILGIVYYRVYIFITSYPTVSKGDIIDTASITGANSGMGVVLNTDGSLGLWDNFNGIQLGSNSAVLNLSQQYRIELKVDSTTLSSNSADARIDGVSFATGTANYSTQNGQGDVYFGAGSQYTPTTVTYYMDDIAVNDSTGSFQNTYPGAGQIVHLRPSAAGDNNTFTIAVGGTAGASNNFTRVKEVTPNDATDYNADITSGDIDDFNIDDTPASIGSSDTINVVHVGVRYAAAVAVAEAAFVVRCKKAASGTVSESSAITPNSTAWDTNANAEPRNYPLTLYQDPDAGSWTKATLDTAQIGYRISTTNTNAARISTAWMLVDSTPAAAAANTWTGSNLTMLKVG